MIIIIHPGDGLSLHSIAGFVPRALVRYVGNDVFPPLLGF